MEKILANFLMVLVLEVIWNSIRCSSNAAFFLGTPLFVCVCACVTDEETVRKVASERTITMKLMHTMGTTPVAKETQPVSDCHHGNLHPKSVQDSPQRMMPCYFIFLPGLFTSSSVSESMWLSIYTLLHDQSDEQIKVT